VKYGLYSRAELGAYPWAKPLPSLGMVDCHQEEAGGVTPEIEQAVREGLEELSEPILEGMAADVDEVLMCEIRVVQSCGTWRFLKRRAA
jgi:hypothetical protein